MINCAGPNADPARSPDPLLSSLARQGLVRPDACRLGLDVDLDVRLIDGSGAPNPALFAVGPITRGSLWEITSVPDIRVQAASCGRLIARELAAGPLD